MKKFIKNNKGLVIGAIVFLLISLLFPYSGDDWQWALFKLNVNTIIDFYHNVFLNGRYLGNLMAIILCKNFIIRSLIMTLVVSSIAYIIHKETKCPYSLFWLFFMIMNLEILKQSVVWSSGFANYVFSTLLLLLNLLLLRKIYNKNKMNLFWEIFLGAIATISCLVIENMTIFLILFIIILNIIYYIKNKKINIWLLLISIAYFLGTFIMFSHPVYLKIFENGDGYRQIGNTFSSLLRTTIINCDTIQKYTILGNFYIISSLVLFIYCFYKNNIKKYNQKSQKLINVGFIVEFSYIIYSLLFNFMPKWQDFDIFNIIFKIFNIAYALLYFLVLAGLIIVIFKKSKNYHNMLFVLSIIILLIAPLLIVTPIGPRNFFMIYILEMILLFYIYYESKVYIKFDLNKFAFIITIMLSIFYGVVYGQIYNCSNNRYNYLMEKVNAGEKEILLPKLPYPEYVWNGNYNNEYYGNCYKSIYNIDKSVEFKFLSYDDWKANKK